MECAFCRILSNELHASVVFEDASVLAFLDIHPVNTGHTLVIPKRHVQSFADLTTEEVSQLFEAGQHIASHIKDSISGCEGTSLSLADGEVAGQEVPHIHLHVIPRFYADGFGWKFPPHYSEKAAPREELDKVAKTLNASIQKNK